MLAGSEWKETVSYWGNDFPGTGVWEINLVNALGETAGESSWDWSSQPT